MFVHIKEDWSYSFPFPHFQLIQLVWQGLAEIDLLPHATPTHSMELEPYIEEPLPRVPPSLKINSLDLHPRIRHDFVFSRKEDVNAYWETLEYCYTSAELASAKLSFPGSVVHEVCLFAVTFTSSEISSYWSAENFFSSKGHL